MSQTRTFLAAVFVFSLALPLLSSRPAAAQDLDADGLPDAFETALAQHFFPILNLHCGTYRSMPLADKRQLYGLDVPGYTNSSAGRLPFVAHPYGTGSTGDCGEANQCIEIRYGIAWNWDLGDDFAGGAHRGDSETYAILVARKDTDGNDWGVSWDVAKNDVNQWRIMKEFMSAHWTATGDSSSYRSHGNYGNTTYQKVWCAEGKHGMYPSQNACNNGGAFDGDDCSDNRCDIITEVFQKVQNVGESWAPLNQAIVYPAITKDEAPSGVYNVWSGANFGSSNPYASNFTRALNWCPVTSSYCMQDCNYEGLQCPDGTVYDGGCSQDCGWGLEPGGIQCADVRCY
jgi:hypothetical protein